MQQAPRQLDILPDSPLRFLANYILDSQRRSCCKSPPYWWVCFGPIPISFTRALSATQETVGFEHVDAHVTDVMITWIGSVMQKTCHELVEEAQKAKVSNRVATSNIEDLSDGSQVGVFWLEKTEMFLFSSACPFGFESGVWERTFVGVLRFVI